MDGDGDGEVGAAAALPSACAPAAAAAAAATAAVPPSSSARGVPFLPATLPSNLSCGCARQKGTGELNHHHFPQTNTQLSTTHEGDLDSLPVPSRL